MDKVELNKELRKLPSVEQVLELDDLQPQIDRFSHPLVTGSIREVLAETRRQISGGGACPPPDELLRSVKEHLGRRWPGFLTPVINGTGVILHTNLGRATLSAEATAVLADLSGHYYGLEYDLATGERGVRSKDLEELLCLLTGAEAALVVNNNAAAVFLILNALAEGVEVIVSRGELVQIGGGFRIPDIMREGGARLVEVGTTNKTNVRDYEQAITAKTGLLLKVHQSNFAIRGFSQAASTAELKALAARHDLPLVYDLGSGALLDTEDFISEHEPTAQEALADGADVVCFSGDKLLGGPQSGIMLGSKAYLDKLRRHPLLRTVRIGKLISQALTATLLHYLKKEAPEKIPVWRLMSLSPEELKGRAQVIATKLSRAGLTAEVIKGESMVGGGSLPDQTIKTYLVSIKPPRTADEFAAGLRLATPPLLGRTQDDHFLIDVRTVLPQLDDTLVRVVTDVSRGQ
ncbi:MAG: L-seryl-tRNA(Sec) selenium transferase [Dehalococcoidales bacterium]